MVLLRDEFLLRDRGGWLIGQEIREGGLDPYDMFHKSRRIRVHRPRLKGRGSISFGYHGLGFVFTYVSN